MKLFQFQKAQIPLVISIPHGGEFLPPEIAARMNKQGQAIPDTDWFLQRLYDWPAIESAGKIIANVSRYVVDLNRSADNQSLYPGQSTTGLCPVQTFEGEPIYLDGEEPSAEEIKSRVEHYWQPYHNQLLAELSRAIEKFGRVTLLDAHSIASQVPRLFDGVLPDFNLGTNRGESCSERVSDAVDSFGKSVAGSDFTYVKNGRFVGGFITRNYGAIDNVDAVQMELSQARYMNEDQKSWDEEKASQVAGWLESFVNQLIL